MSVTKQSKTKLGDCEGGCRPQKQAHAHLIKRADPAV